ncbi:MAG: hypothetical protein AAF600_22080 [Bacteroidota bacterium]
MPKAQPKDEKQKKQKGDNVIDITGLFADTNVTMKSGHIVRDAEIVGEGKYVKLRFASNKQYEKDGEVKTNTNYFDAMISHNLKDAFETAEGFKKGDWIYLKGEDSTRSFDPLEGYKKTASTIFAYHIGLRRTKAISEQDNNAEQVNNKPEAIPA